MIHFQKQKRKDLRLEGAKKNQCKTPYLMSVFCSVTFRINIPKFMTDVYTDKVYTENPVWCTPLYKPAVNDPGAKQV